MSQWATSGKYVGMEQIKYYYKIMAKLKEEVTRVAKFTKFNIFTRDGGKEVTAPRRMTLDEAMRHFKALAIGGVE